MTLKNKKAFVDALWDWGFLDECFSPTRIRISDLDGIVERNGQVLFVEAKPPGKEISTGQYRLFSKLAARGFSVLVIWGDTNIPQEAMIWAPGKALPGRKLKADKERIKEIVCRWFSWANRTPWIG
jgi:hypothetical protein